MKIGILTYHRSHNYGALLQAIALRLQLIKLGHEAFFIDYWPEYHKQLYDFFSIRQLFGYGINGFFKYAIKFLFYPRKRRMRINSFMQFINEYITPYCIEYSDKNTFDVIVYGSDQIWRKQPGLSDKFNPVYFADNILQTNKHVSYAASMGNPKLDEKDYNFLKNNMEKFANVAVRENSLKEILKGIGIDAQVVVDPTLLLSDSDWDCSFPIERPCKEKYVLYYRLLRNSFKKKDIANFAKKMGCKLLVLEGSVRPSKRNAIYTANPLQFLSLVKYADYILTSSYHGLVFSLIFNKQFFVSFSSNADRAKSLLANLEIENRLIQPKEKIPIKFENIDYEKVNSKMDLLRMFSIEYISKF